MKYLIPALAIILFSCSKNDVAPDPTPNPGVDSTTTLGIQKDIFGSTHHDYTDVFDANNNRLFFAVYNTNTSLYEYYATDAKDSAYQIQPYGNPNYFNIFQTHFCLKPNGDIICIVELPGSPTDSVVTLVNKPHTNNWQVLKRELYNTFWSKYFFTQSLFLRSTGTGRLLLTGQTKAAVSDDDGLTWRETFSLPAGFTNNSRIIPMYVSGSRNFVVSNNTLLYSDNNFETASLATIGSFGDINNRPVKLDDQRLVLQYQMPSRALYQSTNNGQSWSPMPLVDPVDSLSVFSGSYFCFVNGNTIRTRARYVPCNAYLTVDINTTNKFQFYPITRPACPTVSSDWVLASFQRPDKRMYYAIRAPIGVTTYFGIKRDY